MIAKHHPNSTTFSWVSLSLSHMFTNFRGTSFSSLLFFLFLSNVFGLLSYLCKLGTVPFWGWEELLLSRRLLHLPSSKIFSWLVAYWVERENSWQSWINFGRTVRGSSQCHHLCYKYKNKRKSSSSKLCILHPQTGDSSMLCAVH